MAAVASGSFLLRSTMAAAGDDCALAVHTEGLDEKWAGQLEAVRTALDRREDVDRCSSIVLERATAGVRLIVVLQDGRSSARTLVDRRDLPAVVTALLLLPTPRESSAVAAAGLPVATVAIEAGQPPSPSPDPAPPAIRDQAPPAPTLRPTSHRPRLALGGVGGTRWSGTAPAGAIGGFVNVGLDGWVLGAHGRWDGYAATSGLVGYTTQAIEFGADFGHDLRLGGTSLTALAGPRVVLLSQTLQSTPAAAYIAGSNPKTGAPIGWVTPSARQGHVLRIGGALRWNVFSGKAMTFFFAADGEIDVMPDAGNSMPAALAATSPLPIWSGGLALGGEVAVWP
jgi:hypothetical protein